MFPLSEINRRLANMLRIGTVDAVDYPNALARVRFGEIVTDWLPWFAARAAGNREWSAVEVGEQVMVLSPSGDMAQGVILPSLYQAAAPAPGDSPDVLRWSFLDGAVVEYDRAAHRLTATTPGDAVVTAQGSITASAGGDVIASAGRNLEATAAAQLRLAAPSIILEAGAIQVNGPLTAGSAGGAGNPVTIHGPITQTGGDFTNAEGDVVASNISLTGHIHEDSLQGDTSKPL